MNMHAQKANYKGQRTVGTSHSGDEAMELDQVGDNWGNPSHLASVDPQSSGNVPCESQGGDDQNNNKNTIY